MNRQIGKMAAADGGTPLLPDNNFAAVDVPTSGYIYEPSGSPWTFHGGAAGGSGVTLLTSGFYTGNGVSNPPPPNGANQVGFIQGGSSNLADSYAAYIQQSDTFAAGDYALSLYAAQRADWNHGGQTLEILIDNQVVDTFTPAGANYQLFRTPTFYLTAGTHTITIAGTNPLGTDNTAFIDDVQMGLATTYTYDADGNQTSVTDPNGNTTTYTYNALNEKTARIGPAIFDSATGQFVTPTTTYTYDANGNQVSTTDPNGNTTTYTYNADNEKISETGPAITVGSASVNPTTTYTYDANGNQTSVTDPNGNTTTYTYNALNEQTAVIQPPPANGAASPTTFYGYDANGNQVSVTDPDKNITTYVFNADNQQTGETINNMPSSSSQYDADGNLVSTINANGRKTTYSYDNLDRQVRETQYNAAGNVTNTITSTYDPAGRLVETADSLGNTTTYTYDGLNRITAQTTTYRATVKCCGLS